MPKYKDKQKPITIEAIQFLGDDYGNLCGIGSMGLKPIVKYNPLRLEIPTLESTMIANVGDWVIKGANREFYPCKPDIFKKTYERLK